MKVWLKQCYWVLLGQGRWLFTVPVVALCCGIFHEQNKTLAAQREIRVQQDVILAELDRQIAEVTHSPIPK